MNVSRKFDNWDPPALQGVVEQLLEVPATLATAPPVRRPLEGRLEVGPYAALELPFDGLNEPAPVDESGVADPVHDRATARPLLRFPTAAK
ncbi:hypothetical protein [Candidatus Palauibacter sp.]|uniref:hypothetical protein n=1 Tax=Candidatus Palauibacter sp. TaxID=3101350 RepID=UPI003AF29A1C